MSENVWEPELAPALTRHIQEPSQERRVTLDSRTLDTLHVQSTTREHEEAILDTCTRATHEMHAEHDAAQPRVEEFITEREALMSNAQAIWRQIDEAFILQEHDPDLFMQAHRCNTLQHAATRCNTLQHTSNADQPEPIATAATLQHPRKSHMDPHGAPQQRQLDRNMQQRRERERERERESLAQDSHHDVTRMNMKDHQQLDFDKQKQLDCDMQQLYFSDETLWRSLTWVLANDLDHEDAPEFFFSVGDEGVDCRDALNTCNVEVEFVEGGAEKRVTEKNKYMFVCAHLDWILRLRARGFVGALAKGLFGVLPCPALLGV